jgi:hypothetical protein
MTVEASASCRHERQHVSVASFRRDASPGKPGLTNRAKGASFPLARMSPVELDARRRARPARRRLVKVIPKAHRFRSNLHVLSDRVVDGATETRLVERCVLLLGKVAFVEVGANPIQGVRATARLASRNSGESPVRLVQPGQRGEFAARRRARPGRDRLGDRREIRRPWIAQP